MSTPVVTEKWAGDLVCSVCRRKRLTAVEFSKKAVEKHRKEPDAPMKCKTCVEAAAQEERDVAATKTAAGGAAVPAGDGPSEGHECSSCKNALPATAFSRSNLSKGPGKQRCSECVAEAEKAHVTAGDAALREKLAAAKTAAAKAEASGSVVEKLAAHSKVAAIEAQMVTGLKPVVLGRGGRGRGGRHGGRFGRGAA
uniref:Stc1 domain-containing protein n=1 Tax=Phaeocystis antarctica TaxID=33657 RepID=A0A7S0EW07_9EUKA|mmetsp:Transcript_32041/g.75641  ORF Transcript_32041/g.75641 Transcript_32041/m.75641 type:complete len:197 (+) Transcript_32041:66-656(+)